MLLKQTGEILKENLLQGGGMAIVEPWVKRVDDFSTSFYLQQNGQISDFSIRRCLVGRSGSFYGMIIEPAANLSKKPFLYDIAVRVAQEIFAAGYFGPVVIDGYSYIDSHNKLAINPLVEINARQTMAIIGRHLLQRWPEVNAILFRLARRKRCRIPKDLAELNNLFGNSHYQAGAARGFSLLTPLTDTLPRASVLQNLFAIAGQDSLDCLNQLTKLESLVLKTKETEPISSLFSLL